MEENSQAVRVRKSLEHELHFSSCDEAEDSWMSALGARINELIHQDFHWLVALLYRLDVNEIRLKQLLHDYPGEDAGRIIGELIVERQLQKIKSREVYRQDSTGIDENEKW